MISTLQNQIEASELEIQQFKLHISSLQQIIDENQYQTKHIGINDPTLAWSDSIDQPTEVTIRLSRIFSQRTYIFHQISFSFVSES